jgi:hypothetical protein
VIAGTINEDERHRVLQQHDRIVMQLDVIPLLSEVHGWQWQT